MLSTEFWLTSLVVVLIPGTGVIYTVSTGLLFGWRASIAAAVGCTAGIVPHLTASILGLSALLHMSAMAFQGLKIVGAIYLLYLAWSMWHDTGTLEFDAADDTTNAWQIVKRGVLINILNPKLSIFFLAFLPLFVSPNSATPTVEMVFLSFVFMAITLIVFILYGITANSVRQYIINSPGIVVGLQRSFAVAFAALGVRLATTN